VALVCGLVKMSGYFINDTYGLAFQFDFALGILGWCWGHPAGAAEGAAGDHQRGAGAHAAVRVGV
jgi:hypothetical protein